MNDQRRKDRVDQSHLKRTPTWLEGRGLPSLPSCAKNTNKQFFSYLQQSQTLKQEHLYFVVHPPSFDYKPLEMTTSATLTTTS